jgi:hypothetical protein
VLPLQTLARQTPEVVVAVELLPQAAQAAPAS